MLNFPSLLQSKLLRITGSIRYALLERYFAYTITVGIILTTVILTSLVVSALMGNQRIGLILLGACAALVAMVLIYHALEFSVFLLIVISTIVNPALPNDLTVTLLFLMVLLGLWIYRMLVVEQSFASIRPTLFNRFAVLFIIAVIISYIWSAVYVDPRVRYFQEDKFLPRTLTGLVLIFSPMATLLFANVPRSIKEIKRIVWYYIIFGAVFAVPRAIGIDPPGFVNTFGQLPAWMSILALGQILFNQNLKRWHRVALLIAIAAWLYVQIGLGISWVSGWVPVAGGIVVVVMARSRIAFIFAIILVAAYMLANGDFVNRILGSEQEESGATRVEAGEITLDYASKHFLFGTGPAGYYFYMTTDLDYLFQLSHNNYVDIFAQTGIVGFVAWILMWLGIGWSVLKAYLASPPSGFVKGLSVSLLAIYLVTLGVMMLGDWVTPFTYTQTLRGISYTIWPWVWAGLGIALHYFIRQGSTEASTPPNLHGA